jgi:hypothetical protein
MEIRKKMTNVFVVATCCVMYACVAWSPGVLCDIASMMYECVDPCIIA